MAASHSGRPALPDRVLGGRPTIFADIAMAGFVMVASAWVPLGAQIAVGRAQPRPTGVDVLHQTLQA